MIFAVYVPLSFGGTSEFCELYFLPQAANQFPYFSNTISLNAVCIFGLPVVFFITPLPRYLTSGL
jgi:hypothetical protein